MATLDDDIDRLYQGPFDAFTDARNALAKAAKRPELKKLEKPTLAAWAVNQLHWHHRPVLAQLGAAAAALQEQHHRTLAGEPAEIHTAEQVHKVAGRQALAAAKEVLRASGHPETPATLDAIRNTLQALPAPEAQGRLTGPLAPRGLEALAGLVLPARAPAMADDEARAQRTAARRREAERFGARARDGQEHAQVRRQADAERTEREQEKRAAAAAAVAAAETALKDAEAAVREAEHALATRQAERYAAQQAVARARQAGAD